MAKQLITCPHCRKLVDEDVDACPKCGQAITPEQRAAALANNTKNGIRLLVFIGVVLCLFLVWLISDSNDEKPQPIKQQASEQSELSVVQKVIGYQLRVAAQLDVPSDLMRKLEDALGPNGTPEQAHRLTNEASDYYATAIHMLRELEAPADTSLDIIEQCELCRDKTIAACEYRISALSELGDALGGHAPEESLRRYRELMNKADFSLRQAKVAIDLAVIKARDEMRN